MFYKRKSHFVQFSLKFKDIHLSKNLAPSRTKALEDPDIPHRVKKLGKTYEITFRPVEVGTHKGNRLFD